MKRLTIWSAILVSMVLLSGCGKFENITIHGMKNAELRGIKDGKILLNLTLDIENPNNRKITISKIEFKAWLKNRELGKLKNSKKITLKSKTRQEIEVPVEIVLRTAADIFKLTNIKGDFLEQLTIEGFIKGRSMCISKKIIIEKQPFSKLANSYKGKGIVNGSTPIKDTISVQDTIFVRDTIPVRDTLKIEE